MDLTLSRTGDYAVRAAIALAGSWDREGYRTIRWVADEMELPLSFTPQILGLLSRAGLAESRAGRGGGYRLSRSPAEISMLEVVEAAEGHLAADRCTLSGGPCRWDEGCAVHPTWVLVSESVRESLAKVSLDEVARVDRGLAAGIATDPKPSRSHVESRVRSREAAAGGQAAAGTAPAG